MTGEYVRRLNKPIVIFLTMAIIEESTSPASPPKYNNNDENNTTTNDNNRKYSYPTTQTVVSSLTLDEYLCPGCKKMSHQSHGRQQRPNYQSTAVGVDANGNVIPLKSVVIPDVDCWQREYYRRRARHDICNQSTCLPALGIAILVLSMIIGASFVIFSSGGSGNGTGGGRRGVPDSSPASRYSEIARSNLKVNLNNKLTRNVQQGCEATILIFRHCEKSGNVQDSSGNEHCSYLGYERSHFIQTLFGDGPDDRWPSPSYLYAMSTQRPGTNDLNYRQHETLNPLSDKFGGLAIDDRYGIGDNERLARSVFARLRNGELCGKIAVISWRSPDIAPLAQKMGCGPYEGCPMEYHVEEFDDVWQLKFVYRAPPPPETPHGGTTSPARLALQGKEEHKHHHHHHHHNNNRRQLRGTKPQGNAGPLWSVYGSVVRQGFDPLQFSKKVGDYPLGGVETGGRWMDNAPVDTPVTEQDEGGDTVADGP